MKKKNKNKTVRDKEFYSTIGKMGGIANKRKQLLKNPNYFADIGERGGRTMKERVKNDVKYKNFFSTIGKEGARKIKEAKLNEGD